MCGIVAVAGRAARDARVNRAMDLIRHRGPDDEGRFVRPAIALGHRRLSIIDLSASGRQPMASANNRFHIVLNGEIYNYLELRAELRHYPFQTATDTEVLLAAFETWGPACLDRLIGMFAFAIWDEREQSLFLARDRFGVKPLYVWETSASLYVSSEPKALLELGASADPDLHAWRQYLAFGLYEHSDRTFFQDVRVLPAGHYAVWKGQLTVRRWYDLPGRVIERGEDRRGDRDAIDEYTALLDESIQLRFRSDVQVGVNLSSGLDSSLLLALIRKAGRNASTTAFTYTCGEAPYDEAPDVARMLMPGEPWVVCPLDVASVPERAALVSRAEDEPFGGLPTLMTSVLAETAKQHGVTVLLDGQGMDEQWGGYDYYWRSPSSSAGSIQGSRTAPTAPDLLAPSIFDPALHEADRFPRWTGVPLVDLRLKDILHTKIPRALRFNDRATMLHGCELREPFLDHRLVELALAQPEHRLRREGERKFLLRRIAGGLLPDMVRTAAKKPVQSPQREWLSGPLAAWTLAQCQASERVHEWFRPGAPAIALERLRCGDTDNSFALWQMVSVALWDESLKTGRAAV